MDSQAGYRLTEREQWVSTQVVGCAYQVHRETGPGLLEHVYELCLCHELTKLGLSVQRQWPISVTYDGLVFDEAYRIDILVEDLIVCELKSVEEFSPVHRAQLLTYLKFSQKHVGFLLNFNTDLMKHGIRRMTCATS